MDWPWLLLLGFGTGAYGVLVGAGGGLILSPALLILFNMEPRIAAGTSLALVAVNTISGAAAYRRMGLIDYRSGLLFAAVAIPGTVLAPFVLVAVAGSTFRLLFGLLLIALSIQMFIRRGPPRALPNKANQMFRASVRSRKITTRDGQVFQYAFNEAHATVFNLALGFLSSFFGIGGGFLLTPMLVYAFSFPVRVAVATSIFTLSLYTLAGAVTHASLGHVDWYPTFLWAGIGLVAGGQLGAWLSGIVRGQWILRLLLVLVLTLGIILLVQGVRR